jgi:hypothetical protein
MDEALGPPAKRTLLEVRAFGLLGFARMGFARMFRLACLKATVEGKGSVRGRAGEVRGIPLVNPMSFLNLIVEPYGLD